MVSTTSIVIVASDLRLGTRQSFLLAGKHERPQHYTTMAAALQRVARPSALRGIYRNGMRSMSGQFGFQPQRNMQQPEQQTPRAISLPIPYVTETTVGTPYALLLLVSNFLGWRLENF